MKEQVQEWKPRKLMPAYPAFFMIVGSIFLAASIFILLRAGVPGSSAGFVGLSVPGIPIGGMLFLIGLVNTTKRSSLHWLRVAVSILCGVLLGLAVLWFLLVFTLLIVGF